MEMEAVIAVTSPPLLTTPSPDSALVVSGGGSDAGPALASMNSTVGGASCSGGSGGGMMPDTEEGLTGDGGKVVVGEGRKRKVYEAPNSSIVSEDENMRTACDACTSSKVACTGGRPCSRCRKRNKTCVFSEKRRCGPKRRDDGSGSPSHSVSKPGEYTEDHVPSTFDATTLNEVEKEWLRQFVTGLNAYLPVVGEATLTLAVRPLPAGAEEVDRQRRHACRAALWGSVSLGALVCKCDKEATRYNQRARMELKECFDAPVTELTSVFLLLTVYYLHRLDNAKLVRYAGFARQSLRELAFIPADLAATVRMLQVSLYLAGAGEPPEVAVPPPRAAVHMAPAAAKQRCLHIIAFLMMSVYTSIRPDEQRPCGTVPVVTDAHLLQLAAEIRSLVEASKVPDDMSVTIGAVIQGYLLLRTGNAADAIRLSECVAEMVACNPAILQYPLTWTMACCVLEGLRRFGRHAPAERLIAVMTPLAASLPFASKCCSVGAELLAVYAGNGKGMVGGVGDAAEQLRLRQQEQAMQLRMLQQAQDLQIRQLQQQQAFQHQQAAAAAVAAANAINAGTRPNSAGSDASSSAMGGGAPATVKPPQVHTVGAAAAAAARMQGMGAPSPAGGGALGAMAAQANAAPPPPQFPQYQFTTGYFNATEEVMPGFDDSYMAALLAASAGGPSDVMPFHDVFTVNAH